MIYWLQKTCNITPYDIAQPSHGMGATLEFLKRMLVWGGS